MKTAKKKSAKTDVIEEPSQEPRPVFRPRAECVAAGKALRENVPLERHAEWKPSSLGRDLIDILEKSNQGRVPELVPIRYGRMLRSPFTFLRGSAAVMAHDLATTPNSGIQVQACGDCHLLNFGLFATPERNLVFDINDFDETLPAPWEWDVKRLATSFFVAARDNDHSDEEGRAAAVESVRAYRERLRDYSKKNPLEVWYERLDAQTLIDMAPDAKIKKRREKFAEKARQRVGEHLFPKISETAGGRHRLIDQPPLIFHVNDQDYEAEVNEAFEAYRLSLSDERRVLLDRFRLEDTVLKVVGIGSVGTRCFVDLFFSPQNHPLLLQFKEARPSVLEPYAGKSRYENQGQRVVMGQRLMQSSSDIFLGWTKNRRGHDFYGRQLRDMKISVPIEGCTPKQLKLYAEVCGWTLARAHAKAGDAATISGYLGKSDTFDQAIGEFARSYADQTQRDHGTLAAAAEVGRVETLIEEDL
ncbi:DUF2252 domain-containing protein [Methylococcus sp. EFPC2]|uniref:DUF2252 domain-containing protein n=1 Tax=Methylococcus sp. EFPC2 TaxID=2812648 RepID=UPI0019675CDF|nr:DUF2252 domain-containing protein [Methylococcus sp. EFPC2]QSA97780.1 DUF2252 domain-containing protein [Methylococcus sp. EFPC2]